MGTPGLAEGAGNGALSGGGDAAFAVDGWSTVTDAGVTVLAPGAGDGFAAAVSIG